MSVPKSSPDLLAPDASTNVPVTPTGAKETELAGDAQWKVIQKNCFTRWTNEHLKTVNKHVADLATDLSDGLRLIALVEVLSGKRLLKFNRRPNFRTMKLENVTMALKFLEDDEGIKIVNIDSSDIVDNKLKLILGLIWTLILHYSISMDVCDCEGEPQKLEQNPKQRLIGWIHGKLLDRPVGNFTTDWNDGKAIGALVDSVAPGLCPDWESWNPKDNIANATEAMTAAEDWLDVPQLITPAEMCDPNVDELSVMTYISQFRIAKLKPGAPLRPKTNPARVRDFGPGLQPTGNSVGAPARFTIETFSAGRGELEVIVINPNGAQEPCEKVVNKDRNMTISCHYTPTMEGQYTITIKFAGQEIPKSPFVVAVKGMAGDPSKVTASGPGLEKSGIIVKQKTYFEVHTKNAGMGVVDVIILDPHGHKDTTRPVITKTSDELWRVEYTANADGLHSVNIFFAGKSIPNSPFGVGVAPAVDPRRCFVTGRGVQLSGIRVGDQADFRVQTAGAGDGELKVEVVGSGGVAEKVPVKKIDATTYECIYEPKKTGEYLINVTFGGGHVFKSPFVVEVGPAKPTTICVYGPGLEEGVAHQPACFTVETGGETGALGFSIEGPSLAKITFDDNGDGSANVTYLLTKPGEYAIHILYDEEDIQGSPWMANIKPASTDFNASMVKTKGLCIGNEVVVNEPVEFIIDTSKAGRAFLKVTITDEDHKPVDVTVTDNKDGTYICRYVPKKAIKYVVIATYGGVMIPNFPARLYPDHLVANPTCAYQDLVITVDNKLVELYIDGRRVTNLPNANNWQRSDTVMVPASAKVIAFKAEDVGVIAGILASGADFVSDGSWKCTATYSEGWQMVSFDDSNWPAATIIGKHGVWPWGKIAGISDNANWIWTPKYNYGPDSDKVIYCRIRVPVAAPTVEPKTLAAYPGQDFVITVDNKLVELYIDGWRVSGLPNVDDWQRSDTVRIPTSAKVIAVKAEDVGVIAGILASGADFVSDGSWKCTATYSEGWQTVFFDDSNWPAATIIGKHGVWPWGKIAGISENANWIWTPKYNYGPDSDKVVYFRIRVSDLLVAAPTVEPTKLAACADQCLVITVDNKIVELYIDGCLVTNLPNANNWQRSDTVKVPASAKVIAVKGKDVGYIAGILASGANFVSDRSWKCTATYSEGWQTVSFDDCCWPAATVIGKHGMKPWGKIAGISNNAKWIWTPKYKYGPRSDKVVYCRFRLPDKI